MNSIATASLLTPAAFNQLLSLRVGQVLASQLPEVAGLVTVAGVLAGLDRPRGQWHYGVRLKDDGGQVLVDIPDLLVQSRQLRSGQRVRVTGVVRVRNGLQAGSLEMRLEAAAIEQAEVRGSIAAIEQAVEDRESVAVVRHAFPVARGRALRLALVHSTSRAQVLEDFMSEIHKLGGSISVAHHPANMREAVSIVAALNRAQADIVVLIRGGGDESEFEVFDDPRVVAALAAQPAYRVIGLGHSANRTALDAIADHAARTPGQAGMYIREMVMAAHNAVGTDPVQATPSVVQTGIPASAAEERFPSPLNPVPDEAPSSAPWSIPVAIAAGTFWIWVVLRVLGHA